MDRLSDFDYDLPESFIAQSPLADRAASKMLCVDRRSGAISHRVFRDLPRILQPGDLLVLNDTRVTAKRLKGRKPSGGEVEALLLKEIETGRYEALLKPAKRLQNSAKIVFDGDLIAEVVDTAPGGGRVLQFEPGDGLAEKLLWIGTIPLPPYIHEELRDSERYQTVYALTGGSSAAPTAGLHFTPELIEDLKSRGVEFANVTLDVGIDTFRPVTSENLDEHEMHGENFTIPAKTADAIRACNGRVIAVGTTSVRALETAAIGPRSVEHGSRISKLFIRPGYEFKVIDGMLTNFHMPRTTMLLMISAIAGNGPIRAAYAEALSNGYRFLSFGDSMLIL